MAARMAAFLTAVPATAAMTPSTTEATFSMSYLQGSTYAPVVDTSRGAGMAAWDVPLGGQDAEITVLSSFVWLGNWVPVVFCGLGP